MPITGGAYLSRLCSPLMGTLSPFCSIMFHYQFILAALTVSVDESLPPQLINASLYSSRRSIWSLTRLRMAHYFISIAV